MFVLVGIYVYMIKMMIILQFSLSLVMSKVMRNKFEYDQRSLDHENLNLSLLIL